jgi:chemotaxis protein MotD
MMEAARAAPVLNLDAKTPAKPGAAGAKAEAGDRKIRFQDTLDRQIPTKNQQNLDPEGGKQNMLAEGPQIEIGGETPETRQAAPAASQQQQIKKPVIELSFDLGTPGQPPVESEAEPRVPKRIDLSTIAPKPKAREKAEDAPVGDRKPAADIDLDLLADTGNLETAPAEEEPRHDPEVRSDATDRDNRQSAPQPAASSDAPVKDVLNLLQDKAQAAAAVTSHARTETKLPEPKSGETAPEVQEDGTADGAVYRLSRADGKGGSIDIPGPVEPTQKQDAPSQPQTVNQVVVVDQRRYLAPAQDNALAVVNTISGNPEWISAAQPDSSLANAAAMAGSGKVVNTLKIQMNPIELGLVTATMRLAGEELTVELKVETGAAYRQLKEDQSRIVEALKAQGFSVDQVSVVLAPERADAGNGQSNTMQHGQGGQNGQQNQARDGAQGQAAGRGNGGYQQERARNGNSGADEGRSEVGSAGGVGPAGTGHIYL